MQIFKSILKTCSGIFSVFIHICLSNESLTVQRPLSEIRSFEPKTDLAEILSGEFLVSERISLKVSECFFR